MFARSLLKSVLVAAFISTAIPTVALADESGDRSEQREGKGKGKNKGKDKAHFPMPAAEFKAHAEKRITRVRERMEKHLDKRGASAEERKTALAKLDAGVAKVRAAVEAAAKDGTVTKEEAKDVRKVAREARGEHGKGHKKGHGGNSDA